jgi:hypothetical protein
MLAVAGAVLALTRESPEGNNGVNGAAVPGPVDRPHCGGQRRASLEEAISASAYTIALPEGSTLVDQSSLDGAWDCPGSATLLEFSSGVTIGIDTNTITDPEASWKGLAATNPSVYSVGDVQGAPALLIDPRGDPTGSAEGGVTFVLDGVYVSVGGDGTISLQQLVDAARTLTIAAKL